MIVSRNAGKSAVRFLSFIVCVLVVIAGFSLTRPVQSVSADGGMWSNAYNDGNPDEQIVQFGLWGYNPGDVVEVTIEVSKYDFYTTAGSGVTVKSSGEGMIVAEVTYADNNTTYKVAISDYNMNNVTVVLPPHLHPHLRLLLPPSRLPFRLQLPRKPRLHQQRPVQIRIQTPQHQITRAPVRAPLPQGLPWATIIWESSSIRLAN